MKKSLTAFCVSWSAMALICTASVFAADQNPNLPDLNSGPNLPDSNTSQVDPTTNQMPGTAGNQMDRSKDSNPNQSGAIDSSANSPAISKDANKDLTVGQTSVDVKDSKDLQAKAAKSNLTPQVVFIQSSLLSAQNQIKGLRADLKASDRPNADYYYEYFKMHSKEINNDVQGAGMQGARLNTGIKKFPELAKNEDFHSADAALNELKTLNTSWQAKIARNSYWNDKQQVTQDLDAFEKRLNMALDKTKSFSASGLDVSAIG